MVGRPVKRARGGAKAPLVSRPPFQPGHELSMRSGAWSKRRYEPLAEELIAGVLADRPDLGEYPEAVAAWADSEARAWLLREWLTEVGMFEDGELRDGPLRWLTQFDRRAESLRGRLGLDPRADAELRRDQAHAATLSIDLDGIVARGREVLDARSIEAES